MRRTNGITFCRIVIFLSILSSFTTNWLLGVRSFALSHTVSRRRSIILQANGAVLGLFSTMSTSAATAAEEEEEETKKNNIRWGIVGLGDVCRKKSGPAFYKCDHSQLVAVMRRTPGKAKEFAKSIPQKQPPCEGYETLEEFLQHPNMDAVYVSTRPGTHLEICKAVANAGKACYVEKPVGRCAQETKEIVDLFQAANLPLYSAYISRAYDRTQAVRKLLQDEDAIGNRLTKVSYTLIGSGGARDMGSGDDDLPWRLDPEQSGGGLIMDVGCHIIDRIEYLCGGRPLVNVQGEAKNNHSPKQKVEDYVHLTATIGSNRNIPSNSPTNPIITTEGAMVECTWDFASPHKEPMDRLVLEGSNGGGSIQMTGMSPNAPVEVYDADGRLQKSLEFEMPEHTAQALIQAVTNDLLASKQQDNKDYVRPDYLSFGDNALRTQQVIDTVLSPYYGGREIGYWSRPLNH
eukprot:scaffold24660_cov147-Cylindrotheca_fusiformis.AAC.3